MDPTTRELTHADLRHEGVAGGYDSPAMRRRLSVPGADLLPGGMSPAEAFAIDNEGVPLDLGEDIFAGEGALEDEGDGLSDDALLSLLEAEERDAIDFSAATVAEERAEAMEYYFGRPFGNEEDNRSTAICTEVFDAVETMLPGILKPFVSGEEVATFDPVSEADADQAEQETAYMGYMLMRKNAGFSIIRKWIWDGLAQKNGVVKYWWDRNDAPKIERYKGITQDVLELLLVDGTAEIISGNYYPMPGASGPAAQVMQGMGLPPLLFDVVLRTRPMAMGYCRVENVPPEEFLIARDATDVNPKKARFCEHRRLITLSGLREMIGPENVPDDLDDIGAAGDLADITGTPEFLARHADDSLLGTMPADNEGENQQVVAREMYYRLDYDGDGYAELRKFLVVGRRILINEEVEEAPFCAWTPYVIPHRYFGVSVADLAMDFQAQKSTVQRQALDNIYGINNNRSAISKKVAWDDLLNNVVDGFVRVNAETVEGHIMPLAPQPIVGDLLPMIQYLDAQKENRLGYSRTAKGMSANSISKDPVTATEVDATVEASQERTQLIARTFAEDGLVELLIGMHGVCRRNASAPDTFRMTQKWVTVDPRFWRERRNMTVTTGLGTGNKTQQLAFFTQFATMMQQAASMGMCGPEEFYNVAKKMLNLAGERNVGLYVKDPSKAPPPPPQVPESVQMQEKANEGLLAVEQVKQQTALAKAQLDNETRERIELRKAGVDLTTTAAKLENDSARQDVEVQQRREDSRRQDFDGMHKRAMDRAGLFQRSNQPRSAH